MNILDREMFFNYIKSYIVCAVSLLGLFIVVDLFNNLDDFLSATDDTWSFVRYVAIYYASNSAKIFDSISEAIVLVAAMFTVALLQRNNELVPLLSAGVSTRRVVRPVFIGAVVMLGLSAANQELILPNIDPFLVENRGDATGSRATNVAGDYEGEILIFGDKAIKNGMLIRDFVCVIPPKIWRDSPTFLQAKEARYIPPGSNRQTGGWLMTQSTPPVLEDWVRDDLLEMIEPGKYFLYTHDVDFASVTRIRNWHLYTPTWKLVRMLSRDSNKLTAIAVLFHMRLARPILGMILVFLGLSVILRDQNRNVFISTGLCLALCAIFFGACFSCQSLGNYEYVAPAVAAWLPVVVFGPFALVMFDAIHT